MGITSESTGMLLEPCGSRYGVTVILSTSLYLPTSPLWFRKIPP
jgi:hypothetical protein